MSNRQLELLKIELDGEVSQEVVVKNHVSGREGREPLDCLNIRCTPFVEGLEGQRAGSLSNVQYLIIVHVDSNVVCKPPISVVWK